MKKIFSFIAILLMWQVGFSQSTVLLRGDTIKIMKNGGNAELVLMNATRSRTNAFLKNTSNGITNFSYAIDSAWMANDSVLVVRRGDGNDSLLIGGTGKRFAVSGEDDNITQNRTAYFHDTYYLIYDSIQTFSVKRTDKERFRVDAILTNMYSPAGSQNFIGTASTGNTMGVNNADNFFTMVADSFALRKKMSYEANFGSLFNIHTLVDKNYVDSIKNTIAAWGLTGNIVGAYGKYIGTNDDYDLRFFTNNTERMRIDSSTGNVGALTTLTVGNGAAGTLLLQRYGGGEGQIESTGSTALNFLAGFMRFQIGSYGAVFDGDKFLFRNGGNNTFAGIGGNSIAGDLILYYEDGADSPNEGARLNKAGEFQIGNTTDIGAAKLQVGGNVVIGTPGAGGILGTSLQVEGTSTSTVTFTGGNTYSPSFVFNGSTGLTSMYTIGSQNLSTNSAGNTIITGGNTTYTSGAFIQGYQQAFTLSHYYSSIGGGTLILDQDNGGASVPDSSTYNTLKLNFHTREKFTISGAGKIKKYAASTPADGELLIGKTSTGTFEKATLSSSDGSITISNGGGTIDLTTTFLIDSGTYSPTLTNTTNIASSTAYTTYYIRVGEWIYVWGEVDIDATTAATISEMGMSLPVTSAFANTYDLAGTASFEDNTSVKISCDVANGRAKWRFTPQTNSNNKYSFHFSYKFSTP